MPLTKNSAGSGWLELPWKCSFMAPACPEEEAELTFPIQVLRRTEGDSPASC